MNLREAAKGKPCTIRIAGVCNRNPETTVLAHIDTEFKGMALKSPDICAVRACFDCHDWVDRRRGNLSEDEYNAIMLEALCRTLKTYVEEGLICTKEQ